MRSFLRLADSRLTTTQKTVLCASAETLRFHQLTMTGLADLLSRRTGVPYSTVKWNLRSLMDLGLLTGTNGQTRGAKVVLTEPALMLVQYLQELNGQ
ncbi:MAG: hypothetical protein K9W43_03150 [Candidatus Thorarchaeota archaeon]|nr:hypothetical protein [Candidatus Thorarchaeota archaeon]